MIVDGETTEVNTQCTHQVNYPRVYIYIYIYSFWPFTFSKCQKNDAVHILQLRGDRRRGRTNVPLGICSFLCSLWRTEKKRGKDIPFFCPLFALLSWLYRLLLLFLSYPSLFNGNGRCSPTVILPACVETDPLRKQPWKCGRKFSRHVGSASVCVCVVNIH